MNNERLNVLLKTAVKGELSDEERNEMMTLLRDPAHEQAVKDTLLEAFHEPKELVDVDPQVGKDILAAVLNSDRANLSERKTVPLYRRLNWAIAAAIALIFLSIAFFFIKQQNEKPIVSVAAKHLNDVDPGANKATLTLADGSVITLNDATAGKIAQQAGMVISKTADGQILYELSESSADQGDGYNTISTPYGGRYEIVLQDGTHVVLNSGSSIRYPLSFKGEQRRVTLSGEAYFEVAKDKSRPFIVATPASATAQAQEIKVLGTHFNVNAYADEKAYVTTLLEGSVKVGIAGTENARILKPGQQSILRQQIQVKEADTETAVAWKNGLFALADEPVEDMMRKLARWYNVEIVYQGTVPQIGFWAQISKNKKLSEVLDVLEETNGIHFKIEGRRVIVMQ